MSDWVRILARFPMWRPHLLIKFWFPCMWMQSSICSSLIVGCPLWARDDARLKSLQNSGYISPYIPPFVIIQIHYHSFNCDGNAILFTDILKFTNFCWLRQQRQTWSTSSSCHALTLQPKFITSMGICFVGQRGWFPMVALCLMKSRHTTLHLYVGLVEPARDLFPPETKALSHRLRQQY